MIFVVRTMNLRLIREIGWREIMRKLTMLGIIGGAALLTAMPISLQWSQEKNVTVTLNSADAKVGQPLSAGSVAGVKRRQGRREQRKTN
jgi:Mg/Co/Ni transporter MgtE